MNTRQRRPPKCEICKADEAIWAMQFIASDTPDFYTLGSHIRGFSVIKLCDDCAEQQSKLYTIKATEES